jgi:hypothetical protein
VRYNIASAVLSKVPGGGMTAENDAVRWESICFLGIPHTMKEVD